MRKIFIFTLFLLFSVNVKAAEKHNKARISKVSHDVVISDLGFLQINLSQKDCEKMVEFINGKSCFRRDHMRDKPYYHQTKIKIFNNKIFAMQVLGDSQKPTDKAFLKIKNGSYKLKDEKENLISFYVKNGEITNFKLLKGNLEKEQKTQSKCDLAENIYGFYQAYDKTKIFDKSAPFRDEDDFEGLKEILFFVEKSNQAEVMVLQKDSDYSFAAVKEIRLCKVKDSANLLVKHISQDQCAMNHEESAVECAKYKSCEDYLVVKNCDVVLLKDGMN